MTIMCKSACAAAVLAVTGRGVATVPATFTAALVRGVTIDATGTVTAYTAVTGGGYAPITVQNDESFWDDDASIPSALSSAFSWPIIEAGGYVQAPTHAALIHPTSGEVWFLIDVPAQPAAEGGTYSVPAEGIEVSITSI
jgi:hypothetical protein